MNSAKEYVWHNDSSIGWCTHRNSWITPVSQGPRARDIYNGDAAVIPYKDTMRLSLVKNKCKQVWIPRAVRLKMNECSCENCEKILQRDQTSLFRGQRICGECLLARDDDQEAVEQHQLSIDAHTRRTEAVF